MSCSCQHDAKKRIASESKAGLTFKAWIAHEETLEANDHTLLVIDVLPIFLDNKSQRERSTGFLPGADDDGEISEAQIQPGVKCTLHMMTVLNKINL